MRKSTFWFGSFNAGGIGKYSGVQRRVSATLRTRAELVSLMRSLDRDDALIEHHEAQAAIALVCEVDYVISRVTRDPLTL